MALPRVARASRRSSAEIGLAYENHSLAYLNSQLHMLLRRVGRAGDGGIDLRGSWWVPREAMRRSATRADAAGPSTATPALMNDAAQPGVQASSSGLGVSQAGVQGARRIRVVGQCKAERKALGPRVVRELEGVVGGLQHRQRQSRSPSPSSFPSPSNSPHLEANTPESTSSSNRVKNGYDASAETDTDDIIGILLSQSGFSKSSMQHASRSGTPLMLIHLLGGHPHEAELETQSEPLPTEGAQIHDRPANVVSQSTKQRGVAEHKEPFEGQVESIWWNAALSGPQGVFGGKVELKREMVLDQAARAVRQAAGGPGLAGATGGGSPGAGSGTGVGVRWGLWYAGQKMGRMGPIGEM